MKVSVRDEKDLIHNALDTLNSGENWIKNDARRGNRFCISGVLAFEAGAYERPSVENQSLVSRATRRINKSIQKLFPEMRAGVVTFNDAYTTKWEDVEAVLKDAMK